MTENTEKNLEFEELFGDIPKEPIAEQPKEQQKQTETPQQPQKQEEKPITETPKKEEPKQEKSKFDYSPEKSDGKVVITIYSHKGEGKTALALSFSGKISAISFDHKTQRVKDLMYAKQDRIIVYDGVRYYDESSDEAWLQTSAMSLNYIYNLLQNQISKDQPDWILLDGMEIFYAMSEMTMRYKNNLKPYEGITNRNIWKQRRMFLRQVHNLAIRYAKKGVIYTTYTEMKGQIIDAEGNLVNAKEVPRWYGVMELETDVTIRTEARADKLGNRRFFALIENSKIPQFRTNDKKDVTDICITAFIEGVKPQSRQTPQQELVQEPQKTVEKPTQIETQKPEPQKVEPPTQTTEEEALF